MGNPTIAGSVMQGANTAFNFGTGMSQFLKAKAIQKKLDAQGRPKLTTAEAFKELESLTRSQYLDPNFAGQTAIENMINTNTANQIAGINDTAGSGSQALIASLVANDNAGKQLTNVGLEASNRQAKDLSQLYDVLGNKANLENQQFDFNVVQPYKEAGAQAQALSQSGLTNIDNSMKDAAAYATALGMYNAKDDENKAKVAAVNPNTKVNLTQDQLNKMGATNAVNAQIKTLGLNTPEVNGATKSNREIAENVIGKINNDQLLTPATTPGITVGITPQNSESVAKLAEVGLITPNSLLPAQDNSLSKNIISNGGMVKAEDGETVLSQNGDNLSLDNVKGDIHEFGGVTTPLKGNEKAIFSNRIGYNTKGEIEYNPRDVSISFAEASKKIMNDMTLTKHGKKDALDKLMSDSQKAQDQIVRGYSKGAGMSKAMFGMNAANIAKQQASAGATPKKDKWGNFLQATEGMKGTGGYLGDGTSVDSQTQQQMNQVTGALDNVPIVGQFKAIGDMAENMGGAIGGEYGSNIVQGFTNPAGRQIEVFKNDNYSRGQRILATLFPFASGFLKPHKDKENLVKNTNNSLRSTGAPTSTLPTNYLTPSYI